MMASRSTISKAFALFLTTTTLLLISLAGKVNAKTAVVFGATGAVGNEVLRSIIHEKNSFTKVILVGRKEFPPKVTHLFFDSSMEVTEVVHPDLGTIDQHQELVSMSADACFVAAGSGFPARSDLHDWHYIEVEMAKSMSRLCGSMNAKVLSVFTAVSGDKARPYSEEELQKKGVPMGWMPVFSDTLRMMRLKEEAVISSSKGKIPFVRIFMPSDIITKEIRYGWLDWSIFKFHAVFDDWLPTEYHSVTTEFLAEAMVKDSDNVLSGQTPDASVTFLKYGDFATFVGEVGGQAKAKEL